MLHTSIYLLLLELAGSGNYQQLEPETSDLIDIWQQFFRERDALGYYEHLSQRFNIELQEANVQTREF